LSRQSWTARRAPLKSLHELAALERSNANFSYVNFWSATDKSDSDADTFGHSYFRNAPTVSSDLIIMLRDDLDPGPPGRPLESRGFQFWRVPPGFPARN
jgi:hypothetical protein